MATPNSGTYRCTFSLPRHLATDIAFVAKRMGVSQSAMLAELLAEPIAAMRSLAEQVPEDHRNKPVDPDTVRRLRGQSADLVRTAVRGALELANSLDPSDPIVVAGGFVDGHGHVPHPGPCGDRCRREGGGPQ